MGIFIFILITYLARTGESVAEHRVKVGIRVFPSVSNPFTGISSIHLANPGLDSQLSTATGQRQPRFHTEAVPLQHEVPTGRREPFYQVDPALRVGVTLKTARISGPDGRQSPELEGGA